MTTTETVVCATLALATAIVAVAILAHAWLGAAGRAVALGLRFGGLA